MTLPRLITRPLHWPITPFLCLALLLASLFALQSDTRNGSLIGGLIDRANPWKRYGHGHVPITYHLMSETADCTWRFNKEGVPQGDETVVVRHDRTRTRWGVWHPLIETRSDTLTFQPVWAIARAPTPAEKQAILDVLYQDGEPYPPERRAYHLAGGGVTSHILWHGVLGDAAVLLTLLALFVSGRNAARALAADYLQSQNRCPGCGYPLPAANLIAGPISGPTAPPTAGPTRCPECGTTPEPPRSPTTPP